MKLTLESRSRDVARSAALPLRVGLSPHRVRPAGARFSNLSLCRAPLTPSILRAEGRSRTHPQGRIPGLPEDLNAQRLSTPVELLLLAIAAAFYPALLAVVIIFLGRPHPKRSLTFFLAGRLAREPGPSGWSQSLRRRRSRVSIRRAAVPFERRDHIAPRSACLIGAGAWILALEGRRSRRSRRRTGSPRRPAAGVDEGLTAGWSSVLGIVLEHAGRLVPDRPQGHRIVRSTGPPRRRSWPLVLFNLIMFSFVEAPPPRLPRRTRP